MESVSLERKWSKPSLISKHLNCSICEDIFTDPRRLSCSHTFCEKCIMQWFQTQKTCPQCRKVFKVKDLGKDLIAEKIINDLEVFCINDKYCKWKDKLELLPKHVQTCEFQDKNLKDWLQGFDRVHEKLKENNTVSYRTEYLQERLDNEVPKAPLLARLYTKDSSSKALFGESFNQVGLEKEKKPQEDLKENSFDLLEGFFREDNEETYKEVNSGENESIITQIEEKIMIGDESHGNEELKEDENGDKNEENKNTLNFEGNERGISVERKRKCKEPLLIMKLKQLKSYEQI